MGISLTLQFVAEYVDFGDMTYTCEHCQAQFWYEERAEKSRKPAKPTFSLCCMKGKIYLPVVDDTPKLLKELHDGTDHRSKHFLESIRTYNSMFSFTSIGGKIDSSLNNGGGPPQFVISGQNYHRLGSLLPLHGQKPKFAQLYLYDTKNEVQNRMAHFR